MKFGRSPSEAPEVNLTSLIDCVLLLIIFFVLASTFNKPAALNIELPEASSASRNLPQNRPISVSVDANGHFYVDGRLLGDAAESTVVAALRAAAGGRRNPPLLLYADAHAAYASVVRVMDAARQLGFVNLTFATREGRTGHAPGS